MAGKKPEVKQSEQSQHSAKSATKEEAPASAKKKETKSEKKSLHQLIIESGFHWDVDRRPGPKGPRGEQNPEMRKFKEIVELAHLKDSRSKRVFWNLNRRRQLREVSVRVFTAGLIACVMLAIIAFLWYYHFSHVYNIHEVRVAVAAPSSNNSSAASAPAEEPIRIETPFISGIKGAEWAFELYAYGLLFLTVGSICAHYARQRPFKYRVWLYLAAILLVLGTIIYFALAPIVPLFAENDEKERKMLESDGGEYKAYQNDVKGSLDFFRKGQCENIDKSTEGKDDAKRIFFCEMISRLTYFLYFMWVSIVVPLLILVLCLMEILANARSWQMKAKYSYKRRTAQQIEADKSRSQQTMVQTNVELLF